MKIWKVQNLEQTHRSETKNEKSCSVSTENHYNTKMNNIKVRQEQQQQQQNTHIYN